MRLNRSTIIWATVALLILLPTFLHLAPSGVNADDAYRTTTITNSGGNVTATLNSTYNPDEMWQVTWYVTPSGQAEGLLNSVSTTRSDGITSSDNLTAFAPTAQFRSGDIVRAHFQTFSSGGTGLFSFSRSVTIP
jgi:hypothetical protein